MKRVSLLFSKIILFFCCVTPLAYSLRYVMCNDVWLHLGTGRWIWRNLAIPRVQMFSFMLGEKAWIDHEWFFQVVVWPLYKLLGINGLVLLRFLVMASIILILFLVARRIKHFFLISSFTVLICAAASHFRLQVRPELFSLFFIVIFIYALKSYKGKSAIFLLLPLQVIWVNMHGYFITGPVIILAFIISKAVEGRIKLPFEWNANSIGGELLRKLIYLFLSAIAVSVLNPYFLKGAAYPFGIISSAVANFTESSYAFEAITELSNIPILHIIHNKEFSLISLVIILFVISVILNINRLDIFDISIFALFFSLSIIAERHLGMLVLSTGLLTLFNLYNAENNGVISRLRKSPMKKLFLRVLYPLFVIMLIFNAFDIFKNVISLYKARYIYNLNCDTESFILGQNEFSFNIPYGPAEFIKDKRIKTNIFNFFNNGAYLVFALYPDCRVFMDGRTEVQGDTLLRAWDKIRRNPELIERVKDNLNIECVVLPCAGGFSGSFFKYLYKNRNWKLVFFDGKGSVFLSDNGNYKSIIDKNSINLDTFSINADPVLVKKAKKKQLYPEIFIFTAKFFYDIEIYNKALCAIDIAEDIMPDYYNICNLKAVILFKLNRQKESAKYFIKAARLAPGNPEIYNNIGIFYKKTGRPGIARSYFNAGLDIDPGNKILRASLKSLPLDK